MSVEQQPPVPDHLVKDEKGVVRHRRTGAIFEVFEGFWQEVKDGSRDGWWRFNEHYDRNGYCDNPARGY